MRKLILLVFLLFYSCYAPYFGSDNGFVPNPTNPDNPNPTDPDNPNPTDPDEPNPTDPDEPNPTDPDNPNPTDPDEPNPTDPDPSSPQDPQQICSVTDQQNLANTIGTEVQMIAPKAISKIYNLGLEKSYISTPAITRYLYNSNGYIRFISLDHNNNHNPLKLELFFLKASNRILESFNITEGSTQAKIILTSGDSPNKICPIWSFDDPFLFYSTTEDHASAVLDSFDFNKLIVTHNYNLIVYYKGTNGSQYHIKIPIFIGGLIKP